MSSRTKYVLLFILLLPASACRQEIQGDGQLPVVTSVLATNTPVQDATQVVTSTPTFSPTASISAGAITIIAIGDDLTYGDGDKTGNGYPERLLIIVNQIRPGSKIINLGRSGWTSDNVINGNGQFSAQLKKAIETSESAMAQGRASVALVWIGGNDLWELYAGKSEITPEQEDQDARRFSDNVDVILSGLNKAGIKLVIAKLDDQSKRPARTRGEKYPFITESELHRMSTQVGRYNEIISKKAVEYNAVTVDFYSTELFTNSETLAADGYHPNPFGYDLIAQAWYKALINILP